MKVKKYLKYAFVLLGICAISILYMLMSKPIYSLYIVKDAGESAQYYILSEKSDKRYINSFVSKVRGKCDLESHFETTDITLYLKGEDKVNLYYVNQQCVKHEIYDDKGKVMEVKTYKITEEAYRELEDHLRKIEIKDFFDEVSYNNQFFAF